VTVIKKVISVSSKIEIGELRAGISRFHRMHGFAPPKRVLLEFCRQLPWCQIEGNIVSADPPLDWEEIFKGTTEWAMAAILKEYGLVMPREEFEKRCVELGMNKNTFYQYLTFSPIITKYSIGVYGLRGAVINPGIIESIKPKRKPKKVLNDYGWTSDGKIWLGLQISTGTIQTGVCSIPSAMYKFLNGEFRLRAADGIHIGILKIKKGAAWSLKKFFQRRGGDPGDFLVIKFDLTSREARIYLGDKDLLDDFRPEF
jgi:hypothetical protein